MPAQPIIFWGSSETMSGWGTDGPTITTGQADPFGGTTAIKASATTADGVYSPVFTLSRAQYGVGAVLLKWSAGSGFTTRVSLFDATTSATIGFCDVTWNGTTGALASSASTGLSLAPLALGGGWYLVRAGGAVTFGNNHRVYVYPRVSGSGTCDVVLAARAWCILPTLDEVALYPEPREGSQWIKGPSAAEDAWITGTDYLLAGRARFLPELATDNPEPVSGWQGTSVTSRPCATNGVMPMLAAGRDKQTLTALWVRGSADYYSCTLDSPMNGTPTIEDNGLRSLPLAFRMQTYPLGVGE